MHLDALAGKDTGAIEMIGKPYETNMIVEAVTRAIEQRRSAHARIFGQPRAW
jgi:FixJ family two-component response regulator